jgi:hypothetical protein
MAVKIMESSAALNVFECLNVDIIDGSSHDLCMSSPTLRVNLASQARNEII